MPSFVYVYPLPLFVMSRLASVAVRSVKLSAGYINAAGVASVGSTRNSGRAKSSACLTIWGVFYSLLDFHVGSRLF